MQTGEKSAQIQMAYTKTREILLKKGLDLDQEIRHWIARTVEALQEIGIDSDFIYLCDLGCDRLSLTLALFASDLLPVIARAFRATFGMNWEMEGRIHKLRAAAETIKELPFAQPKSEALFMLMDPGDPNRPPLPSGIISGLEFYAKYLEIFELLAKMADIRSKNDLPRYLITSYVRLVTKKWNDQQVSALLHQTARGVYDATAHRMWRSRNFGRLDKKYYLLPEMLQQIGNGMTAARWIGKP